MNNLQGQYIYAKTNGGVIPVYARGNDYITKLTLKNNLHSVNIKRRKQEQADYAIDNKAALTDLLACLVAADSNDPQGHLPESIDYAIQDLSNYLNVE